MTLGSEALPCRRQSRERRSALYHRRFAPSNGQETALPQRRMSTKDVPKAASSALDDASLKCWGQNIYGELGQYDHDDRGDRPNEMGHNLPPVVLGRCSEKRRRRQERNLR